MAIIKKIGTQYTFLFPVKPNKIKGLQGCTPVYFPIWWGTNPKIIQTFLDTYDLSSKTVYTFCTSGSSGIESSVSNLQNLYSEVNIVSGHRFEVNSEKDEIASWIEGLN